MTTGLIILAAVLVGIVIYAAMQPDRFVVTRTARIDAPADRIFRLIDDLKAMNSWNPFVKDDPTTSLTYTGPERGVGATSAFGGGRSGAGQIAIVESIPPRKIVMQLDMTAPLAASNRVEFAIAPVGAGADVTWSMSGKQRLPHKVLHLVFGGRMVGRSFERGLADLKTLAEGR